jgi:Tfp pilus assembly major pilin PilA
MPLAGEKIRGGRVQQVVAKNSVTSNSSNVTTTETTVQSVTASLISGEVYKITWLMRVDTSVNGDDAGVRIREDNSTGTEIQGTTRDVTSASLAEDVILIAFYTAAATASKTFVGTIVRTAGTGNLILQASSVRPTHLTVELTGL